MLNIVGNYSRISPGYESRAAEGDLTETCAARRKGTDRVGAAGMSGTRDGLPARARGPIRWEHHERIPAS